MKLTETQKDEIQSLSYGVPYKDQGQPHCRAQAFWGDYAVIRTWDWDDDCGRISNTRLEYRVYEWDGKEEDPNFQSLSLGKLLYKFTVPSK
jgi:hypothetical protein